MACNNSFPCVPCPPKDCGPKCMTAPELACMPQCPSICPPQTCGPQFVKVQQPPKLVCQKQVVYTKRTVIDKHVMPNTKEICEPRLIYQPKVICEPCIVYKKRVVPEPKIVYYKRIVPDPKVVCQPRTIVEPKEICQTMVCQPKPQVIQIPQPKEYMCAPTGTTFYNRPGCAPVPCLPLAKPCDPCAPKEFSCYDPCCPPKCPSPYIRKC
ncbi:unnamed protein product [Chironomus riparius]|uniref:Uncharacterized protein n=1 Tax=Chironomus riparius TaxID=315576 RepID=A0A9N9S1K8_9DIPT|nr:unnamed protein product [Chironomus riparius]